MSVYTGSHVHWQQLPRRRALKAVASVSFSLNRIHMKSTHEALGMAAAEVEVTDSVQRVRWISYEVDKNARLLTPTAHGELSCGFEEEWTVCC